MLPNTPSALSMGRLIEDHGCSFQCAPGNAAIVDEHESAMQTVHDLESALVEASAKELYWRRLRRKAVARSFTAGSESATTPSDDAATPSTNINEDMMNKYRTREQAQSAGECLRLSRWHVAAAITLRFQALCEPA